MMFDEYRERRFAAPPTLRKMVAAGWYGSKSGKGFYDYSGEKPVPERARPLDRFQGLRKPEPGVRSAAIGHGQVSILPLWQLIESKN